MTWYRYVDSNAVNTFFPDTAIDYITINASEMANATQADFMLYLRDRNQPLMLTLAQVEEIVGSPLPAPL